MCPDGGFQSILSLVLQGRDLACRCGDCRHRLLLSIKNA
jgi:hypothetical protein